MARAGKGLGQIGLAIVMQRDSHLSSSSATGSSSRALYKVVSTLRSVLQYFKVNAETRVTGFYIISFGFSNIPVKCLMFTKRLTTRSNT